MTVRIACLHTAQTNVAVFEAAGRGLDARLSHVVRDDLLRSAEAQGGLTPEITRQTAAALLAMTDGVDAVLLTCSTVGPGATEAAGRATIPILRTDAALAETAVRAGGRVVVLCAVATTVAPTQALFAAAAEGTSAEVAIRLVDGAAWAAFRAGDQATYFEIIARACDAAFAEGADVVALAQASMSGAATLVTRGVVLTSPTVGLASVRSLLLDRA
jgi:Asp/Glu/Hydantoin racemase